MSILELVAMEDGAISVVAQISNSIDSYLRT
jgi:hypothetical protein